MGIKFKTIRSATNAPFWKRFGGSGDPSHVDYSSDNGFRYKGRNAADSGDVVIAGVSDEDLAVLGGEPQSPARRVVKYEQEINSLLADQVFFIAPKAMRITGISEVHNTVGSDGSAVTVTVRKCTSGQTIAQGTALLSSAFSLKATTRVVQDGTLISTDDSALELAAGDRLAVDFAGTLTAATGVCVSVYLDEAADGEIVNFYPNANADCVDSTIFVATRPVTVTDIRFSHQVVASDSGAVTAVVKKDTGTDAPVAGTALMSDTFNCKSTVNVPQTGTLATTAGLQTLAAGDRLSVDFTGTLTALAGVCISVRLKPLKDTQFITIRSRTATDAVDRGTGFIADRDYEVVDGAAVWSTAGGASNASLTKDVSNNAPSAGTALLTQDSNAGWQTDNTANTVEVAALTTVRAAKILKRGDRLAINWSGTVTNLVGFTATIELRRI